MAKPLNFAVVGLGMGKAHCRAVAQAKGAHLAAVCDVDEERLNAMAEKYDAKPYSRWRDVVKDAAIDAVCICVESGKHARLGIEAARAGKHIIVEKPVDITPARIKQLDDEVKKFGVKCGCIFQSRFDPCNIRLKKAMDSGKMGRIFGAHAHLPWFRADTYYQGPHGEWKGTWKLDGGGSLMNQGIHTVDLVQWLVGPVEAVCGFYGVFNHDIEAEDQTVAILKFENGALGTLYTTTCCIPGREQRIHIYGEKGSFSKYGGQLEFYELGGGKERRNMMEWYGARDTGENVSSDPMAVSADGHTLTVEDLVKAVRTGRDPAITIESATHAVEIAAAIFKSGRTRKVVKVESVRAK